MICIGLLLMWCHAHAAPPPPPDSYCRIARPVRVSRADTRATKEQADIEIRKYKAVCGGPPK